MPRLGRLFAPVPLNLIVLPSNVAEFGDSSSVISVPWSMMISPGLPSVAKVLVITLPLSMPRALPVISTLVVGARMATPLAERIGSNSLELGRGPLVMLPLMDNWLTDESPSPSNTMNPLRFRLPLTVTTFGDSMNMTPWSVALPLNVGLVPAGMRTFFIVVLPAAPVLVLVAKARYGSVTNSGKAGGVSTARSFVSVTTAAALV